MAGQRMSSYRIHIIRIYAAPMHTPCASKRGRGIWSVQRRRLADRRLTASDDDSVLAPRVLPYVDLVQACFA